MIVVLGLPATKTLLRRMVNLLEMHGAQMVGEWDAYCERAEFYVTDVLRHGDFEQRLPFLFVVAQSPLEHLGPRWNNYDPRCKPD